MNKLSKVDLESALGKLLKKKSNTKDPLALEKINGYILIGLYNRIGRIRTLIRKYLGKIFFISPICKSKKGI